MKATWRRVNEVYLCDAQIMFSRQECDFELYVHCGYALHSGDLTAFLREIGLNVKGDTYAETEFTVKPGNASRQIDKIEVSETDDGLKVRLTILHVDKESGKRNTWPASYTYRGAYLINELANDL